MMRSWAFVMFSATLYGCGGHSDDHDHHHDSGMTTGMTTGTTTGNTSGCTALMDGAWVGSGAALGGMPMGVMVMMDVAGGSFTLTDWDMVMGELPDGGTVAGDQVTLMGTDPYWATCTGTVSAMGDAVVGVCADDGAGWDLTMGTTGSHTMP